MKYNETIVKAWFKAHGIESVAEYRFDMTRRWRSDFFIPPDILIEVEGGAWVNGRHNRASGFIKDMEKYSRCAILGFRLIRVTPDNICTTDTIQMIEEALLTKWREIQSVVHNVCRTSHLATFPITDPARTDCLFIAENVTSQSKESPMSSIERSDLQKSMKNMLSTGLNASGGGMS